MQSLIAINETKFIGQCDRYPSHLIPNGTFSKIDNVFVENNSLIKRNGSVSLFTSLSASYGFLGASAFEPNGGSKVQVFLLNGASNARFYTWNGSGSPSTLGAADITKDLHMTFVQASNSLFGFNGTEVVDIDSTLTRTVNRAGVPKGKYGEWFHNYLFVAGVSAYPNRVYWSDLGVPTTFTGANFVDINANDGDFITAIKGFNDQLLIFKNNSVWAISGWAGSTFSATTIAGQNTQFKIYGYGTPSHDSVINVGKDLYYISMVAGIPHFRSFTTTSFGTTLDNGVASFDIENTLVNVNKSLLSKCVGTFDGKRAFWSLPTGSNTTNDLTVVLRPDLQMESPFGIHRSWVTISGIVPASYFISTISGRPKTYFVSGTEGKAYLAFDTTYADDTTAVTMDVRTKDYHYDDSRKSKFKYLYTRYKSGSAGDLIVNARVDQNADYGFQESIPLTATGAGLGPTGSFTLGVSTLGGAVYKKERTTFGTLTGTLLGIQYKESTANSCEIYDFSIFGYKKGLRDD